MDSGTDTTTDTTASLALSAAIRSQWPNMPLGDVKTCVGLIEKEAEKLGTKVTNLIPRKSYLAVEAEGLPHRLAYVHLGYIGVRSENTPGKYREIALTRYEKKPRHYKLPEAPKRLCPECFLVLPTSGAPCSCTE